MAKTLNRMPWKASEQPHPNPPQCTPTNPIPTARHGSHGNDSYSPPHATPSTAYTQHWDDDSTCDHTTQRVEHHDLHHHLQYTSMHPNGLQEYQPKKNRTTYTPIKLLQRTPSTAVPIKAKLTDHQLNVYSPTPHYAKSQNSRNIPGACNSPKPVGIRIIETCPLY